MKLLPRSVRDRKLASSNEEFALASNSPQMTSLGQTGLSVSNVSFGLAPLGDMPETYGHGVSAEQARSTLHAIFDSPVNFIDTARNYGLGRSEERIGEVIRERGGLPRGFVVSTKLDRDMQSNRFDGAQARRSLEQSLKAMSLDQFQMLHLHDPEYASSLDDVTGVGGALSELFKMKEEGFAQSVGLAAGKIDVMMPLLRDWDFDVLITHNRFTLVNRNADDMINFARKRGTLVFNAAPYSGGVLAKGSTLHKRYVYQAATAETLAPVARLEEICARHAIPLGAAALQFSLRDPRIASTIVGISRPERITQTLEWSRYPIPQEVWDELLTAPHETGDPEATRVYTAG